jgi:superfamily II DNA or RNA helicase
LKPRKYQSKVISNAQLSWLNGNTNVLAVAPTGAGKTLIKAFMAEKFSKRGELVVIMAHRDVLLSQISLALSKVGLPHKFICSKPAEREIGDLHVAEFGHSFISEKSNIIVASVLTWINRDTSMLAPLVKCWMLDEAHHLTIDTSWHKCIEPMVNAKGMGVTATPLRADGKGLGRDCGGVFDDLVLAPTMDELIEMGNLSPYRIYTVPSELDLTGVNITSGGDYNQKKLAAASDTADITGDAVEHYKRLSYGKQAMTFCVSIEHAKHVAQQFNDAGIPSVALSSKSKLAFRQQKINEFKRGLIMNLVNCDLFSEGFDVPACTTVIMLRKTMSYGLFKQQFGRMLRIFEGKEYGILLDHVGNVAEHCIYGSPSTDPEWSLEPPKKKKKNTQDEKALNTRTCPKCFAFYLPKTNTPKDYICPYCNHAETEEELNKAMREIQVKEGTLVEYDDSYLNGLLRERDNVDVPVDRIRQKLTNAPDIVKHSAAKNHLKRQEAQRQLRDWIQSWCEHIAIQKQLDHETVQGEFARVFGKDVYQAQVLGERQATELLNNIKNNWSDHITLTTVI